VPRVGTVNWPKIPDTCKNPIVFEDKNMGICMVAEIGGVQWIMKVNAAGNWMTIRPVGPDDPTFVEALNKGDKRVRMSWILPRGVDPQSLSDDLLLDNFHWSKTSDKEYDLFRAELVRRLNS